MAYENLCMYCFEDLGGKDVCPHCGRDSRAAVPQIQLLPGTLLYRGRFLVGRAMGQDAGGIVYMAFDTKREGKLRIREYLPRDSAKRLNDGSVVPAPGAEDAFDQGLKKLRASVEKVEDPKKRHFFFEENGTAYIAQRKSAAAAAATPESEDEPRRTTKQLAILIGGAAVVVLAVAFLLIRLLSNAFDTSSSAPGPSPSPSIGGLWIPEETPSPTPYASQSYAPIKDPELSWMDYIYHGNVENEFEALDEISRTPRPTATPTPRPTNQVINANSSASEIASLQWQLIELGWLNSSGANGRYDSATKQAVRDFQKYMNSSQNAGLTVDGIAGPATLHWLAQYPLSIKPNTPTATPTPTATAAPVIDQNSSPALIRLVQDYLVRLNMLDRVDGVYGAATSGAVWEFQDYINRLLGRDVLQVTGKVDDLTLRYLEYVAEWWDSNRPSASPSATVTATPTLEPTNDPDEGDYVVDQNSPAQSIRFVQERLVALEILDRADGVYGPSTLSAVRYFQNWVNSRLGAGTLEATGLCDARTLEYLEEAYNYKLSQATSSPTATQTATPTPTIPVTPSPTPTSEPGEGNEDDVVVGPDAPAESIRFVQEQLATLGLVNSVDGVYGQGTQAAVQRFQEYVNDREGAGTLSVTGLCDRKTLQYLENYVNLVESQATPTPEPTDEPVGEITDPEITITGYDSVDEGVHYVQGQVTIQWGAGDNASYHVKITDSDGKTIREGDTQGTSLSFDAATLTPGLVYEIEVTATPIGGAAGDARTSYAFFAVEASATEPPAQISPPEITVGNLVSVESGVSYVQGDTRISWQTQGEVAGYRLTLTDADGNVTGPANTADSYFDFRADSLIPGMVYELSVGAIPLGGSEADILYSTVRFALSAPAATEPPVAEVSAPTFHADNIARTEEGVHYLSGSTTLTWAAEGDVQAYQIRLEDSVNGLINQTTSTNTSMNVNLESLQDGVVYTLTVGAIPTGGTEADAQIANFSFARAAAPEPTEPPVAEVSAPSINFSGASRSEGDIHYFRDSASFTWSAEGDVQTYVVRVVDDRGNEVIPAQATERASWDLPVANLTPGVVYTLYVGAIPSGGTQDDMRYSTLRFAADAPEITEPPATNPPAATTLDRNSSPEAILSVQTRLYQLGYLLTSDNPSQGVFDFGTRSAIARFQEDYNLRYADDPTVAPLPVIDPSDENAVVDQETIRQLAQ